MFKIFEFNSIRSRMVTGFLFLTFLILILAVVSLFIIERITEAARVNSAISQLETHTLNLIKSDNDFFDQETINRDYFKNHQSSFLITHDTLVKSITSRISLIIDKERSSNVDLTNSLQQIDSTLKAYDLRFRRIENLLFQRGFMDYGVEGAMRYHAHALEEAIKETDKADLLYLRRHEKDFLLRNDTLYVNFFLDRVELLFAKLTETKNNDEVLNHLHAYESLFLELATLQQSIGPNSKTGLRSELNTLANQLAEQYYALSAYSYSRTEFAYHNLRIFYIILLAAALLFSIISAYWISKKLSEPITRLSSVIQDAVFFRNTMEIDLRLNKAAIEISSLAGAFNQLLNQAKTQMLRIKTKSTLLKQKNRELKKLNRELDNFLYSTAHDLRSPLSSLLGLINIMRYENKQPDLEDHLDMMEKSVQRSENFISQIVSYSKNKRMDQVFELIDLEFIINHILEDHRFVHGANRISKMITINNKIPFYSDRNRVIILFTNLISNAIKYADLEKPSPYIRVIININEDAADIQFSDNGLGIRKEHLPNIFKMFYRAHDLSKGSGLGLFIFKETITRMNGHVTVESTEKIGTKFTINLPNHCQAEVSIKQHLVAQ
ncbi:sensor histidine kinase [Pseudochryseolinea flava]|uniref:histidine kinase n=1 Tax=Pseudochryseolinea flava TaxID=2059302 RepID=A0A364XY86_9BACT|nr:HAMP domain-containing sensor histidine kinase [Pseudochryseolinea flava]RAV99224.1 hypothetical protein DQQ10_20205 [Pseudochryseolinea flava]